VIPGVIAKRYATALLELGAEAGQLDQLVDQLGRFAQAYEVSPELRSSLDNPLVAAAAKRAILDELSERMSLGPTAQNALRLLLDRRRIRALPAISTRLREMADLRRGILRAEVLTALPLPEEYFEKLERELERISGRRIALDRKLEPTLLCGVVVRVGDTVYDGSLVARLKQLETNLLS